MKNLLFVFSSFTLFSITKAQLEFCPPGARWTSEFNSGGFPQSNAYNFPVITDFVRLDTFNNEPIKVISSGAFFLQEGQDQNSFFIKQKGDTVFFYSEYTTYQWQILFNFSATVGQKWYNSIQNKSLGTPFSYTNTVLSTQTVMINGFTLKQQTIAQKNESFYYPDSITYTATERLGSDKFVFTFSGVFTLDGGSFRTHRCYSDSSFGNYYYGGSSCLVTTDLEKTSIENSTIKTFPNPSSSALNLSYKEGFPLPKNCRFVIINTLGQTINEGELLFNGKEASVRTQELESGIYFLRISNTDDSSFHETIRFVKMND